MCPAVADNAQAPLRLLSRPECGLCDEFLAELYAAFGPQLTVEVCDVDAGPALRLRWGRLIPVLIDPSGEAICVTRFDAAALASWLGRGPV